MPNIEERCTTLVAQTLVRAYIWASCAGYLSRKARKPLSGEAHASIESRKEGRLGGSGLSLVDLGSDSDQIIGTDRWYLVEDADNMSRDIKGRNITSTSDAHSGTLHSYGESSKRTAKQRPQLERRGTSYIVRASDLLTSAEVKTWVEDAETLKSELNEWRRGRRAQPLDLRVDSAANLTQRGSRDAVEVRMTPLSPAIVRRAALVNQAGKREESLLNR